MSKNCINCGAEIGLHQYETNKCPYGGYDQSGQRYPIWLDTVFETENEVSKLKKRVAELEAENAKLKSQSRRRKLVAEQGHDY